MNYDPGSSRRRRILSMYGSRWNSSLASPLLRTTKARETKDQQPKESWATCQKDSFHVWQLLWDRLSTFCQLHIALAMDDALLTSRIRRDKPLFDWVTTKSITIGLLFIRETETPLSWEEIQPELIWSRYLRIGKDIGGIQRTERRLCGLTEFQNCIFLLHSPMLTSGRNQSTGFYFATLIR
jgi:hypothetical protein